MKVGLTGGIGSGKSFVADMLRKQGFSVFDCDSQAKSLMVEDPFVVRHIIQCVGPDAYFYDDTINHEIAACQRPSSAVNIRKRVLNRKAVADFLFRNADNAAVINGIVHPRLAQVFKDWADSQSGRLVFMEAAILFESGFDQLVDRTVCVVAEPQVRLQRAMQRDGVSYEEVERRIRRQDTQDEIIARSDYILYNNPDDDISAQVNDLLTLLSKDIVASSPQPHSSCI